MSLSRLLSEAVANWLGGVDMPSPPNNLLFSLFTDNPTREDVGNEINDNGYDRKVISLSNPIDTVDGYQSANSNEPVFGPAISGFGSVSHWGIRTETGQLLLYGQFDSSATINHGSFFYVKTGSLVIRMLGFSDNLSIALLNWLSGVQFPSSPQQLELSLHTGIVEPNDSNLNEVTGGGYSRQIIEFSNVYNASIGNILENISNIIFPNATSSWGVVSHWSVRRKDTGDMITHGSFLAPKLVESGEGYLIESSTMQMIVS